MPMVMQEHGHVEVCYSPDLVASPNRRDRKLAGEKGRLEYTASSTRLRLGCGQHIKRGAAAVPTGTDRATLRTAASPVNAHIGKPSGIPTNEATTVQFTGVTFVLNG